MKKIVWIFSVNSFGEVAPFGYGANMVTFSQAKKFQKKIKLALKPKFDVEFISYDCTSDFPYKNLDFLIFNDMDARYIKKQLKDKGLEIQFKDIVVENIEKLKRTILQAFDK